MHKVLVTGGSGFIGTVVCKLLAKKKFKVVNVDRVFKEIDNVFTFKVDISSNLESLFEVEGFDAIIHLAADHEVGRSVSEPSSFYNNNIINTIKLLDLARKHNVKNFIYSGSSSVYGDTNIIPTPETHSKNPMSPYAKTKDMVEEILIDYSNAYDFNFISLRYFNAAGAMPDISHGYVQKPLSHLIPIVCHKAFFSDILTINGNNYNTPDGTCYRDYTHVYDIANAHVAALNYLEDTQTSNVFNIGTGTSTSILEVVKTFNTMYNNALRYDFGSPRDGDVPMTCADNTKAKELLNWKPMYNIEDIIQHAWEWQKVKNV